MKSFSIVTAAIVLVAVLVSTSALAQQAQGGTPLPRLHVNDAYRDCFFDLHPELTQAEFQEFTAELGSILRFRQLGDVAPRGKGHFDIGVQFASSRINDVKGAWNNTMSHPTADHPWAGRFSSPESSQGSVSAIEWTSARGVGLPLMPTTASLGSTRRLP